MAAAAERLSLLALAHVSFLTPREKIALSDMLGGAGRILSLSLSDMSRLLGRRFLTAAWEPGRLLDSAADCEKRLTADGIGCIFYTDATYPPQLREIFDPPVAFFYRGKLPDMDTPLVGMVGTRLPTGRARKAAFSLAFELGCRGIGIVSGLARGIDCEAHEGCVEAGGYSVAVLGSGIDVLYPPSSRRAAQALLKCGGLIVSEYPPGTPPLKHQFPARNRIISGLCRSVVVVQAPEKSGALFTAEYALEQGRDLFVHGEGLEGGAGAGTRGLADSGAPIVFGFTDVFREWGIETEPKRLEKESPGTGAELACLVSAEITGLCARRRGQTLWRG
jgi:DNA processing protein